MNDTLRRSIVGLPDNGPAVDRLRGTINRADWRARPASPAQHSKIRVMLEQLKKHNAKMWTIGHAWYTDHEPTLSQGGASNCIDRIKTELTKPAPVVETRTQSNLVDASAVWAEWRHLAKDLAAYGGQHGARFAVATGDASTNDLAFWWIVRHQPTKNDMPKYFLRQVIGGQGAVRVRMSPEAMVSVARKIFAAGPKEAMLTYGREIGACGHCGRTLTNQSSREAGIGPVCARGKGW